MFRIGQTVHVCDSNDLADDMTQIVAIDGDKVQVASSNWYPASQIMDGEGWMEDPTPRDVVHCAKFYIANCDPEDHAEYEEMVTACGGRIDAIKDVEALHHMEGDSVSLMTVFFNDPAGIDALSARLGYGPEK